MDAWGWEQLRPWLAARFELPVGSLVLHHRRSNPRPALSSAGVRVELCRLAAQAGVRRRFAPHQLRHAHALAREGVALNIIQRQLGHANLGTTSNYLQGIDTEEIIATLGGVRLEGSSATSSRGTPCARRHRAGPDAPSCQPVGEEHQQPNRREAASPFA